MNSIFVQKNKAACFSWQLALQQLWSGIGAGLFIMAVAALFLDVAAERRAAVYTKGLETFVS